MSNAIREGERNETRSTEFDYHEGMWNENECGLPMLTSRTGGSEGIFAMNASSGVSGLSSHSMSSSSSSSGIGASNSKSSCSRSSSISWSASMSKMV